MKIAYADPPYIGCAHLYPEKEEVDHRSLLRDLQQYDGWALSCSSPSLGEILGMLNGCEYRVGAWVKPFAVFKPNVNPAYAWEPVIFVPPPRKRTRDEPTRRDWVSSNITLQKGMVGAKPKDFCFWIFELLNICPEEDEFEDMYPGSGAVTEYYKSWSQQLKLC
jgi:hypothetical protein